MKASGSLHPVPVKSKIWNQVGMNLIGPLPHTPRGNKYIITLTNYFSNTRQKQRKGGRLDDAFKGPYIVNRSLGKGIYEIQSEGGKVLKQKVNIGRIKVYRKRDLVNQNGNMTNKAKVDEDDETVWTLRMAQRKN